MGTVRALGEDAMPIIRIALALLITGRVAVAQEPLVRAEVSGRLHSIELTHGDRHVLGEGAIFFAANHSSWRSGL